MGWKVLVFGTLILFTTASIAQATGADTTGTQELQTPAPIMRQTPLSARDRRMLESALYSVHRPVDVVTISQPLDHALCRRPVLIKDMVVCESSHGKPSQRFSVNDIAAILEPGSANHLRAWLVFGLLGAGALTAGIVLAPGDVLLTFFLLIPFYKLFAISWPQHRRTPITLFQRLDY